jgi:hypothetical protein
VYGDTPIGYLDGATCKSAGGWAKAPDSDDPISVHLWFDNNSNWVRGTTANLYRADVGNHAFNFVYDEALLQMVCNGGSHQVAAYGIWGSNPELGSSPRTISCGHFTKTDGRYNCCPRDDMMIDGSGNCVDATYYKTFERYTGSTTIVNLVLSVSADCPADNMCVDKNSSCVTQYTAGRLSSSNVDDKISYCGGGSNPDAWIDCDYSSGRCSTCGSLSGVTTAWIEAGDSSVGEYGTGDGGNGTTECCGDDRNEFIISGNGMTRCCSSADDTLDASGNCQPAGYYKTYDRYTGSTTIVNRVLSVSAYCSANNMCVDKNSNCVAYNTPGTLNSANVDDKIASCGGGSNPDAWIDCDYSSARCATCGSLSGITTGWAVSGESSVGEYGTGNGGDGITECCGDDTDEVYRSFLNYGGASCDDVTYERCVNGGDNPSDSACCDDDDDCVYDGTCYSEASYVDLNGNGRIDGWCMTSDNHKGKWRDCDDHSGACAGGCQANWAVGGESASFGEYDNGTSTECCGDDAGEYFISYQGRTACCNSSSDIVNASGECVLQETSYKHNGQPFFPIILYSPYPGSTYAYENLNKIAAAGFNMITVGRTHTSPLDDPGNPNSTTSILASAKSNSLTVRIKPVHFLGTHSGSAGSCTLTNAWPDYQDELEDLILTIENSSDKSTFFGYAFDEPEYYNPNYPCGGRPRSEYSALKSALRTHPTSGATLNYPVTVIHPAANGNWGEYSLGKASGCYSTSYNGYPVTRVTCTTSLFHSWDSAGTTSSMDIYPVVADTSKIWNLTHMSYGFNYLKDEIVNNSNKPLHMVLQGYAIDGDYSSAGDWPNETKTRFMAYDVITQGAKGIEWYNTKDIPNDQHACWLGIKAVASELSTLENVLAAGITQTNYTVPSNLHAISKEYNNETYLIVTNPTNSVTGVIDITVNDWSASSGNVTVLFESRSLGLVGSTIQDSFGPWEVHVYKQ